MPVAGGCEISWQAVALTPPWGKFVRLNPCGPKGGSPWRGKIKKGAARSPRASMLSLPRPECPSASPQGARCIETIGREWAVSNRAKQGGKAECEGEKV